jgi:hypothetical protein
MTVLAEGCFIGPRALERIMRKASLKAHIKLDKGNVSSNREGPCQACSGALGEQKAGGTDKVLRGGVKKSLRLVI